MSAKKLKPKNLSLNVSDDVDTKDKLYKTNFAFRYPLIMIKILTGKK